MTYLNNLLDLHKFFRANRQFIASRQAVKDMRALQNRYILLFLQKIIMQDIRCKKCGSSSCVKSGYIRNSQRYKCKECRCNFKLGDNRGKISPQAKALAMLMYGSGKAS